MTRVITRNIKVHSCRVVPDGRRRDLLIPNERYIGELGVSLEAQSWYYQLKRTCRCRRFISVSDATEFVARGTAVWLLKVKKNAIIPDDGAVWMPVERERVPRVDLITRSDIERAVTGSERRSRHHRFDSVLQRFVRLAPPDGTTKEEWRKDAEEEVKFERRIRKQYSFYIEEIHDMYMENRAKLIVPFRPDPFEGRCLFFSNDQRTSY